jgi:integrase
VFDPVARVINRSDMPPHALRHTAASLANAVHTLLGHESATMTLDLYGHLFADQLDEGFRRDGALESSLGINMQRRCVRT